MNISVELIKKEEISILKNLLQLYLHDISLYFPIEFDDINGTYKYDDLSKYFDGTSNYAYFIKYDESLSGFILIDEVNDQYIVQEMFVLNNFKNTGIGKKAIEIVFNTYRGEWVIKSLPNSLKAENFWNKTIKEYTNDNYKVEHIGKYNRAEFTFSNKF